MPQKKYGYTDDHLIRTVIRHNQSGDELVTTGSHRLGTKSTSHGVTSITPKDDPEYVTAVSYTHLTLPTTPYV